MYDESLRSIFDLTHSGAFAARYDGIVRTVEGPEGYVLLNYTDACQSAGAWDPITTKCRGLIVHPARREVVARPLEKFFNHNEPHVTIPAEDFSTYEKVDGSMGILYRTKNDSHLATRGSFTSLEAVRGTELLRASRAYRDIRDELTLMFEIALKDHGSALVHYPEDALYLLAGVDRHTGREVSQEDLRLWTTHLGVKMPKRYTASTFEDVIALASALPVNEEGYVVRFKSGMRVKVKSLAYLKAMHQAIGVTPMKVLAKLQEGMPAYLAWSTSLPEELKPEAERLALTYLKRTEAIASEARHHFERAPKDVSRKDFALWVQSEVPAEMRGYQFMLLQGKTPNWFAALT